MTHEKKDKFGLEDPISETALLTMFFRALETRHPDPILEDPMAVEILRELGVDMSRFADKRMSQVGAVIRARRFDRQVRRVLMEWERPVVVNLACGLDSRFIRTDWGKGIQVDLDLPDVVALRGRFFSESERNPQIGSSMFETKWMDDLLERYPEHRFAFIMEGVLMYLQEPDIRGLFRNLAERFPGGELHFDVVSTWMARHSKMHDSIQEYGDEVKFTWGLDDMRGLEEWSPALKFREVDYYMRQELRRWGWAVLLHLIPPLSKGAKMLRYDILA
ncbi:MAG: class I SAM-dependent methyltransferase [Fretibacterium sp.]|nr:class I SAM-dependent methyltransferase [Fretibacterium sp.]